jgi:pSer/pThr/pTyr-binding forkhead associated (FHA) protein
MASLVVVSGPLEGKRIELEEALVIGREHADLELDDPEVSRRHVRVRVVDEGVEVEDLGSSNGTRVDGRRITSATVVEDGAAIKVGQTSLRVELRSSATRLSSADPRATAASPAPSETPLAPPPGATEAGRVPPRRAAAPAPAQASAPAPEFGAFQPAASRRRRGVATRLWLPAALTYAAIAGTAAALIVYFAERS